MLLLAPYVAPQQLNSQYIPDRLGWSRPIGSGRVSIFSTRPGIQQWSTITPHT